MVKEKLAESYKMLKRNNNKETLRYLSGYVNFGKYKRLFGSCARASFYELSGVEPRDKIKLEKSILQTEIERNIKKAVLAILERAGIVLERDVIVSIPKEGIVGVLDATIKIEDKKFGFQIEIVRSKNEQALRWDHMFRYAICSLALKANNFSGVIVYYIQLGTFDEREFLIQVEPNNGELITLVDGKIIDKFSLAEIFERHRRLLFFLDQNKLPPVEYIKKYSKQQIRSFVDIGYLSKVTEEKYKNKDLGDYNCFLCLYSENCEKDKYE